MASLKVNADREMLLCQENEEYTIFNYMETLIARHLENGRVRTSETYRAALNSFRKFRKEKDLQLGSLTSDIMECFEAWHRRRGNTSNTISFYIRIIRAVYNRAVENCVIIDRKPFRHVYTGIDKTVKRALPLAVISRIRELDLSPLPEMDFARDMFMLSFYMRGMSFIDMAYLKKSDLRNGMVVYRRRKTGQQLLIGWTKEMQRVLDKYPKNPTQYMLPIISSRAHNDRFLYRSVGYSINRHLKRVGELAGVEGPLTMYVARHSWASAAKSKGIPISVISEGMGHESETTTRVYLASLDTSVIDRANDLILGSL